MPEDKKNIKWKCNNCGQKWLGKSPYQRHRRPFCPSCGDCNVHVYDWLIDKEKWSKIRKEVIERDNSVCQRCNRKIEMRPVVHHLYYSSDYYNLNNLITLCKFCHSYIHKGILEKFSLWFNNRDFPEDILPEAIKRKRLIPKIIIVIISIIFIITYVYYYLSILF
jgi:DNA-directed RNA polymerase subunit RPC12/RpoP